MRRRLLVLLALLALGSLVAALPASAASHDVRAKKKICVLKKKAKCKKANLSKRKIGKQNLAGAKLAGANLSGASLTGTNLAGADLTGANLRGATLKGVNLSGATLTGATFAAAQLDGVDFSAPGANRRRTRSALSAFGCAFSMIRVDGASITARCKGASLRKVVFTGASIGNSDFLGADLEEADFTGAVVKNADFRLANMSAVELAKSSISKSMFGEAVLERATAQGAKIELSDFADALVMEFSPMLVLTRYSAGNRLAGTLGLNGSTWIDIEAAQGTRVNASVEAASNNAVWRFKPVSCGLPCKYDGIADDTFTVTLMAPAGSTVSATSGITCTGTGFITCKGTLAGSTMSIKVIPPLLVTVNSELQNGAPTPMSKIRFESVAANGTRTTLTTCVTQTTCTAGVATGTAVRVSVFRQYSNGYFGMNCPGETGDAFTNNKTLFPNMDDTLSGDPGDTTRYALHRYCDAFTVTGDVTLTAINDTPNGTSSG